LDEFPVLRPSAEQLKDVIRRNLRTPAFLARFFPLTKGSLSDEEIAAAMEKRDSSGMTLQAILRNFLQFLAQRSEGEERERYIRAVSKVQTGSHIGADVKSSYGEEELQGTAVEHLIPNVRLVNGATKHETRQRLMLTFNTPFYPEVLIASSVMAEGVDLHLNCRHVIHHDLCWNPSTLEQRTGRIDRIGAKVERCGKPIQVYLPYIAETQDEKQYRVVMDRERWFKVVMGEKYKVDLRTTDKLAERLPFPESAAANLAFRLEVADEASVR
jgi:superfamily II DNA/RNA helicase